MTARTRTGVVDRVRAAVDRRAVRRAGLLLVLFVAGWLAVRAFGRGYHFFDMKIYLGALRHWVDGEDLYRYAAPVSGLGFTYPPFAAIVMLPIAFLTATVAGWINLLASVAALWLVLSALLAPIAGRYGWSRRWAVAFALPLALCTEPVRESLGYGQVNLLLTGLVVADLVALRRRARAAARGGAAWRDSPGFRFLWRGGFGAWGDFWRGGGWAGVGIGLAAAIKLTPALFIVYLLVTRQWRAARTAIATAAAVTSLAFLLAPGTSLAYFGDVLWNTERVGNADTTPNQSLAGLLARLFDSTEAPTLIWLTFSLVLLTVGLTRAKAAHGEGDELAAFTLVGLTANLVSPVSWTHHLVFLLPAVLILGDAALRRRDAARLPLRRLGAAGQAGLGGMRAPIWFPRFTGARHAAAAVAVYALIVVSPLWPYQHTLPQTSHYADGAWGVLMENSLALLLIVLVTALPWRPGAEPAFRPKPWIAPRQKRRPRR
ncbi:glycosyltransferase 87 family protein [Spirilliplanes yamanashiensis]|nr:glycosyltransferase 87 family protein [Spirilliplanes yamanashiensis]